MRFWLAVSWLLLSTLPGIGKCEETPAFASTNVYLSLLSNADPTVREQALYEIIKIKTPDNTVAERVSKLLDDPDQYVRAAAVEALKVPAESGFDLVKLLTPLLRDKEPLVRRAAAEAIGSFADEDAIKVLMGGLEDQDYHVRIAAAKALGQVGASAAVAVPTLLSLLDDPTEDLVFKVIGTLGELRQTAAQPALQHLLESENDYSRWFAAEALGKIFTYRRPPSDMAKAFGATDIRPTSEQTEQVAEGLAGLLSDNDPTVTVVAIEALGKMGRWASMVVPTLSSSLKNTSPEVRKATVQALTEIGMPSLAIREEITEAVTDSDREVRLAALKYLEMFGPLPNSVEKISPGLRDPRLEIRYATARTLSFLSAQVLSLLPLIRVALLPPDHVASKEQDELLKRFEESQLSSIQLGLRSIRAVEESGREQDVGIQNGEIPIALASWCPYSRRFIEIISDPVLLPYIRKANFTFILFDEWKSVRSHLEEMKEQEEMSDEEVERRLAAFRERAGGSPYFDPMWVENLPGKHYLAIDTFKTVSFPSIYSSEEEGFDIQPKDWIAANLNVPEALWRGLWDFYSESGE